MISYFDLQIKLTQKYNILIPLDYIYELRHVKKMNDETIEKHISEIESIIKVDNFYEVIYKREIS